jgi:polyphosphate kinase
MHDKKGLQYITQIGTGNYNEKTSKQYSDFSLITADKDIAADVNSFFRNMLVSNMEGRYNQLLVAPTWLKSTIFSLIDQEIERVNNGLPSEIMFKMNSLTDRDTIDKLSEASCAGVKIRLIIRGICCIVPGIPGKTENITVRSILGRYLEHSRVYCFGSGDSTKIYISSADLMTRNVERRIEIACPVLDRNIKSRILEILKIELEDHASAWILHPDGNYVRSESDGENINCQDYLMKEAMRDNIFKSAASQPNTAKALRFPRFIQKLLGIGNK